jgi:hypothetical protein
MDQEAAALLTTLGHTPAAAPTACEGWTAHELVAHLAAGAAEMADLTEDALTGRPPRPTRAFDEREAPYVALADDELRDLLLVEAIRLGVAVEELRGRCPDAGVEFAGRFLSTDELTMHGRSEAALHRWDLVGDDEVSRELLRQSELTAHAVSVLSQMTVLSAESVADRAAAAGLEGPLRFASPGQPDVVLVDGPEGPLLELADPSRQPTATADAATRLLALWGRRSRGVIRWGDSEEEAEALDAFLFSPAARIPELSGGRRPELPRS